MDRKAPVNGIYLVNLPGWTSTVETSKNIDIVPFKDGVVRATFSIARQALPSHVTKGEKSNFTG